MTPSSVPFDIIIIIITIGMVWAEGMFLDRVSAPTFPKYWWGGAAAGEWALLGQGEQHKERDTGLWCIVEWIDKGIHLFIDFCILDIYVHPMQIKHTLSPLLLSILVHMSVPPIPLSLSLSLQLRPS